jgi:2-iminobutanoate/2-iminopropanoate deaminase
MKRIVCTDKAPLPAGAYSQAVECNDTLYIAGQVAIDPETGRMVDGSIREQTLRVMKNIGAILEAAGYSFGDVVKSTCLLSDIADFQKMNEIYASFYPGNPPARAAYAVKALPLGALIEIETIAAR